MRETLKHAHELMSQDEDEDGKEEEGPGAVPPLPNGSRFH